LIALPRLAAVADRPITHEPAALPKETAVEPIPDIVADDSMASTAVAETPAVPDVEEQPALPRSFEQCVPAPKPPQAEPDPLSQQPKRTADVSLDDGPFIAPPPSLPERDRAPLKQPDALAEAEAVNPTDRPVKPKRGGFSLFRRKQVAQTEAAPVQPRLESPSPERMRQATPPPAQPSAQPVVVPAVPEAPAAVPEMAAPELPEQDPARPLAPPQTEEDLLEIPSFLRRQAN
jgi:cell division protein FtsZ